MSKSLDQRLSRFTPDGTGLDRDALLIAAGRASLRPNRAWTVVAGVLAACQLLTLVFERESLERLIILGLGLSWHWDTEGLRISRFRYRALVEQLFAPYGFVVYMTSEGNISMDPANILLARLGRCVDQETISRFFQLLLQSDTLPGL